MIYRRATAGRKEPAETAMAAQVVNTSSREFIGVNHALEVLSSVMTSA